MRKTPDRETDTSWCPWAWIYRLRDPLTLEIRYVGKTQQTLHTRLLGHLSPGKRASNPALRSWIESLHRQGLQPEIGTLEMVPVEQSEDAEDWWIYYLLDLGHPLFNVRDGKGCSLAKYKRAVLWWWNGWD